MGDIVDIVDRVAEAICDAGAEPRHKLWKHWLAEAASSDEGVSVDAEEWLAARRLEAKAALAVLEIAHA